MKSPSSFEPSRKSSQERPRNCLILNHFPTLKFAHPATHAKHTTCALFTKHKGVWGIRPKTGTGKNYFVGVTTGSGSFAPSKSTKTWFNFALIWPRSCAFVM
jgi:hypothetical protein